MVHPSINPTPNPMLPVILVLSALVVLVSYDSAES
jgi:hypothetical protein